MIEKNVPGLQLIPTAKRIANLRQLLRRIRTGQIPTAGHKTRAINPTRLLAHPCIPSPTLLRTGNVPCPFSLRKRFKKTLGRIKTSPLIRHALRRNSRLPPTPRITMRGKGPIRRMHHNPITVRTMPDMPLFRHPNHLRVTVSRINRLLPRHRGRTGTQQNRRANANQGGKPFHRRRK